MISQLRNIMVEELYKDLGLNVVHTDSNGPRPDYPFYSYKFTTLRQGTGEGGVLKGTFADSLDPNFKADYVETLEFQPKVIMSFMAYALDSDQCQDIALRAWEWFRLKGRRKLGNNNIVVVDVGDIQDRSITIAGSYEFRQGFDVEFRVLHEFDDRLETIETYVIKEGGKI